MKQRAAVQLVSAAALTLAAGAAAADEPAVCYGIMPLGSPAFSEPSLMVVAKDAPKRTVFAKNGYQQKGCPAPDAACATASYVVPGDPVIVGAKTGEYVCAIFVGRKPASAMTQGWVAAAALSTPKAASTKLGDWVGAWRSGDEKRLTIKRAGDRLAIDGEATWGAGDPQRAANGGVNEGGFDATVTPQGATLAFSAAPTGETLPFDAGDVSCKVKMWRLGPYLVAADNNGCGGANVTFSDVYRRD